MSGHTVRNSKLNDCKTHFYKCMWKRIIKNPMDGQSDRLIYVHSVNASKSNDCKPNFYTCT